MRVSDVDGVIPASVAYQYAGTYMRPAELDPRAWPAAYDLPELTTEDRAQLVQALGLTYQRAEFAWQRAELSDRAWIAYQAIWWYSAPRFSPRTGFPYVSHINEYLDSSGTAETWIQRAALGLTTEIRCSRCHGLSPEPASGHPAAAWCTRRPDCSGTYIAHYVGGNQA